MTPDQSTEQAIQAAGATVAPRLTPDDIDAVQENLYNLAHGPVHTPEWPEPSGRVLTEADSMADLHGYARPDNSTV